jgi:hypothetical protein
VQSAYYDTAAGAFNVPARTTAVFLVQRPAGEQIDVLIDQVDALVADGVINGGQATALKAKLEAAQQSAANGNATAAAKQLNAFINQVEALVAADILTAEEGDALIATAETILDSLA